MSRQKEYLEVANNNDDQLFLLASQQYEEQATQLEKKSKDSASDIVNGASLSHHTS